MNPVTDRDVYPLRKSTGGLMPAGTNRPVQLVFGIYWFYRRNIYYLPAADQFGFLSDFYDLSN